MKKNNRKNKEKKIPNINSWRKEYKCPTCE